MITAEDVNDKMGNKMFTAGDVNDKMFSAEDVNDKMFTAEETPNSIVDKMFSVEDVNNKMVSNLPNTDPNKRTMDSRDQTIKNDINFGVQETSQSSVSNPQSPEVKNTKINAKNTTPKYNIAMCCDFFFPQIGGVEFHIFHLAQKLINDGHNVIVISHNYGDRINIRYLANGLKIYYLPYLVVSRQTSFPTIFASLPAMRQIFVREEINIVHAHGSVSTIAHEALVHGSCMDIPTILTDHSLYPFNSLSHVLVNKLLRFSTTLTNKLIAVSQTTKENLCIRSGREPENCFVIPNAVVADDFRPLSAQEISEKDHSVITVVVISRLYENKGIGLLAQVIPALCAENKQLNFIVAGDGPMFIDLQQMMEENKLEDRVELMGAVPHEKVRDVMVRGDIYLHCSLIEAFGTVLVEAASSGLLIVTTAVGGIPEVLPDHMAVYCEDLSAGSIVSGVLAGISRLRDLQKRGCKRSDEDDNDRNQGREDDSNKKQGREDDNNRKQGNQSTENKTRNHGKHYFDEYGETTGEDNKKEFFQTRFHTTIRSLYNWENVAERTLKVYDHATREQNDDPLNMLEKIAVYFSRRVDGDDGFCARLLYALCCTVNLLYLLFLDVFWDPRDGIERAVKWRREL